MQRYWHILWAACGVLVIIFLFVLVNLFQGDRIIYTDVAISPSSAPSITKADPVKGDVKNPIVNLVEYCQFSSLGCKTLAAQLNEVLKSFPEGVRVVWKDVPNATLAPESLPAALAARCAQDQGLFWEYHDALFANQTSLGTDTYKTLAEHLHIKESVFASCLKKQPGLPFVQSNIQEASMLEITGTPTLYINNQRIAGTLKTADLIADVQQALAAVTP